MMATRVEIRRTLNAPIERVFTAFSDAAFVAQWLRPSADVQLHVLALEFREGGRWRFVYEMPDGKRMTVGGLYRRIEPPSCIVFSWLIEPPDEHAGIESEVTVSLTARDNATELVIRHEGWGRADADARHSIGWQGALDLLAAQLDKETRQALGK
jgi:uncharacterized protein YndB with AHSA1/START domain